MKSGTIPATVFARIRIRSDYSPSQIERTWRMEGDARWRSCRECGAKDDSENCSVRSWFVSSEGMRNDCWRPSGCIFVWDDKIEP